MSFQRKLFNWYYLREQFESLSVFTPYAQLLGFDPAEERPGFRERTLNCRRWTLEELNAWRESMLALAKEAYEEAPAVGNGHWSDFLLSPTVTVDTVATSFTNGYEITTNPHKEVLNPDPIPALFTGTWTDTRTGGGQSFTKKKTVLASGPSAYGGLAMPKTLTATAREQDILVTATQLAGDFVEKALTLFPSMDVGDTELYKVWGTFNARLAYDGYIGEPAQPKHSVGGTVDVPLVRMYSAFGYYGTSRPSHTKLAANDYVLHCILGVSAPSRPAIVQEDGTKLAVMHISRHAFSYIRAPYSPITADTTNVYNAKNAIRWQPSVSETEIEALTETGCTVVLVRIGDAGMVSTNNYVSKVSTVSKGITVKAIIDTGGYYIVRGVPGAAFNPSTPGAYALVIFGACKGVYEFGESMFDVAPNYNGASWGAVTYKIPASGTEGEDATGGNDQSRITSAGYNQAVFVTDPKRKTVSFEHPGVALQEMLSKECVSPADVFHMRYAAFIHGEINITGKSAMKPTKQLALPPNGSGFGIALMLTDGTIAAIGRYTMCADGVKDDNLFFRYKLYSPHGTLLNVSDEGIYCVPIDYGLTFRYADGDNQPHARSMPGVGAAGNSFFDIWSFVFSDTSTHRPDDYASVLTTGINNQGGGFLPGLDISGIDGFADMYSLQFASGYSVTTTGGQRPQIGMEYAYHQIPSAPGLLVGNGGSASRRLMPSKAWTLTAPQVDSYNVASPGYSYSTNPPVLQYVITREYVGGTAVSSTFFRYIGEAQFVLGSWNETEHVRAGVLPPTPKYPVFYSASTDYTYKVLAGNFVNQMVSQDSTVVVKKMLDLYPVGPGYTDGSSDYSNPPYTTGPEDYGEGYNKAPFGIVNYLNPYTPVGTIASKWDGSVPAFSNYAAGAYPGSICGLNGVVLKSTYQTRKLYESPVGNHLADSVDIIGAYKPHLLSGSDSSLSGLSDIGKSGREPMDLFPLYPEMRAGIAGHGFPKLDDDFQDHRFRIALVGKKRKILHGAGDISQCWNQCPERGTVSLENDEFFYTPLSEGLDFITAAPKDEDSPPTVIVVRVLQGTAKDMPDIHFSIVGINLSAHSSAISPGRGFATSASVGDNITEYTYKVGIDSHGNTEAAKYVEVAKSYAKAAFFIGLPGPDVLSPLFVPNAELTFTVEATISSPYGYTQELTEHVQSVAVRNVVLMISVGNNSIAVQHFRARAKDGDKTKILFTVNRAYFSPVYPRLLSPTVTFTLVDFRSLARLTTTSFTHP